MFQSSSLFGNITPNVKWNVLNYGRLINNVQLQQFKTQELVVNYQNHVLTAAREVQTNLRNFLRAQEQADALGRSAKAAEEAVKIGVIQYKSGTRDFNTIYNLEAAQVQQQDQLAVAYGSIALNLSARIAPRRRLGVAPPKRRRSRTDSATNSATDSTELILFLYSVPGSAWDRGRILHC